MYVLCRFVCLLLITVVCTPVSAYASTSPQTADYGKFYVGLGAGVVVPTNTSVSASGAVNGSGNLSYKDDASIMGMAGYHFTDYLTGETELGYSSLDYDSLSGTIAGGGLTGTGSVHVNGHVNAVVGLANAIVTPLGNSGISPYVGGGIGFASTDSKVNSLSSGGVTVADNASNSETNLALDALVGVNFPVAEKFSLGARYQYLWVNSAATYSGSGITQKEGNFGANIITAQATYNF